MYQIYRNACVKYQLHLDCVASCREVCITCDVVVRFEDVLAAFVRVFFSPTRMTHFAINCIPYNMPGMLLYTRGAPPRRADARLWLCACP